jgi:hypothetical protein
MGRRSLMGDDLFRTAKAIVLENLGKEPAGSTPFANTFLLSLLVRVSDLEAESSSRAAIIAARGERIAELEEMLRRQYVEQCGWNSLTASVSPTYDEWLADLAARAELVERLEAKDKDAPTEMHPDSVMNRNPLLSAHFDALDEPKDAFYDMWQLAEEKLQQAEAELAALKARRCETCDHSDVCHRTLLWQLGEDTTDHHYPDACSLWAAREATD